MEERELDNSKLIQYWIEGSDFETMQAMYNAKKYNWALFAGHLMMEKLLKALYVKVNSGIPPFLHNLLRLAELCKIQMSNEQEIFFAPVTAFNINGRYDDYKMSFQKRCTPEYTSVWIEKLNSNRQWIKRLLTL